MSENTIGKGKIEIQKNFKMYSRIAAIVLVILTVISTLQVGTWKYTLYLGITTVIVGILMVSLKTCKELAVIAMIVALTATGYVEYKKFELKAEWDQILSGYTKGSDGKYKVKVDKFKLGDTIKYKGFEIKTSKDIKIEEIEKEYSMNKGKEAILVSAKIKNTNDEIAKISSFDITTFGSKGVELGNLGYDFEDSIQQMKEIRKDTEIEVVIPVEYDGNGKYQIKLQRDYDEKTPKERMIEFNFKKEEK